VGSRDVGGILEHTEKVIRREGEEEESSDGGSETRDAREVFEDQEDEEDWKSQLEVEAVCVVHCHLMRCKEQKHEQEAAEGEDSGYGAPRQQGDENDGEEVAFELSSIGDRLAKEERQRPVDYLYVERVGQEVLEVVPPQDEVDQFDENGHAEPCEMAIFLSESPEEDYTGTSKDEAFRTG
jgi:hypothetical protein